MAYTITKNPDGDCNLGSLNGEFVTLQPSTSDYATGGYALIDGVSVVDTSSLNANVDLYRVLAAIPASNPSGYVPAFNAVTKKIEFFQQSAATSALTQVPANTDLSAYSFQFLLVGQ